MAKKYLNLKYLICSCDVTEDQAIAILTFCGNLKKLTMKRLTSVTNQLFPCPWKDRPFGYLFKNPISARAFARSLRAWIQQDLLRSCYQKNYIPLTKLERPLRDFELSDLTLRSCIKVLFHVAGSKFSHYFPPQHQATTSKQALFVGRSGH